MVQYHKSSHFISKHLRNYYDNNDNCRDCLIVQYSVTQAGELNVYELLIDDKKNRALSCQEIDTPVYNTYMCGPCDGIYYLYCFCSSGPRHCLWNPTLNELKILPKITWKHSLAPNSSYMVENGYGFGYDSKTNDYKVVLILGYCGTGVESSAVFDNPVSILIYSLRSNSWRYWGDMDNSYIMETNSSYLFVNGCYYWLSADYINYGCPTYQMVISFDINADTCQEVSMPQLENKPDCGTNGSLIVYRDTIAFVSVPKDRRNICIWTRSEEVWTPKFTTKLDSPVAGAFSFWRDNMLVFSRGRFEKIASCDTSTEEIFILDGPDSGRCENICAYKESLLSIKGFEKDVKYNPRKS